MQVSMNYKSNNILTHIKVMVSLAFLADIVLGASAIAADVPDSLQLHAFGSQALITTTDNNFFGETSNSGNFDFTELGLNMSVRPSANWQFAGQILARRAGEGDDGNVRLDYGLADYGIHSSTDGRLGIRFGRILNPLGLYNETRDVAFTRPSILLPQSIYFDRARDLALSSDGAQLYGEKRTGINEIFWQFTIGLPRVDNDPLERTLLGNQYPGDLASDRSFLGRVLWEVDGGRIRLATSFAAVNIDYEPGIADPLNGGELSFMPVILSGEYNRERWAVTAEYAQRKFEYKNFHVLLDREFTGESAYLQGVYRFSPNWDALLRYDVLYTDKSDKSGETYASLTTNPSYSRFAKDWTVGLGWNISQSVLIRGEFHKVNGTAWLPAEDNPDINDTAQYWNMFALQVSARF